MQVSHHNKKLSNYSGFVSFPHILDLEKYNFTKSDLINVYRKDIGLCVGLGDKFHSHFYKNQTLTGLQVLRGLLYHKLQSLIQRYC